MKSQTRPEADVGNKRLGSVVFASVLFVWGCGGGGTGQDTGKGGTTGSAGAGAGTAGTTGSGGSTSGSAGTSGGGGQGPGTGGSCVQNPWYLWYGEHGQGRVAEDRRRPRRQ